jgi:hypothetical protein
MGTKLERGLEVEVNKGISEMVENADVSSIASNDAKLHIIVFSRPNITL